jgi:hypothetical protein
MHSYSIDAEERKNTLLFLAALSILLSWAICRALASYNLFLPWWIESPSVLSIYGLLFIVFDNWAWKLFRKIGFSKIPNLKGEWTGHLRSSFDEHETAVTAKVTIFQTWTRIRILLDTKQSSSQSDMASITIKTPEGKYLHYLYMNEPKANAAKTMSIHRGTAKLLYDEKAKTLIGEYYSGRDRQEYGSLSLKKSDRKE